MPLRSAHAFDLRSLRVDLSTLLFTRICFCFFVWAFFFGVGRLAKVVSVRTWGVLGAQSAASRASRRERRVAERYAAPRRRVISARPVCVSLLAKNGKIKYTPHFALLPALYGARRAARCVLY